LFTALTVDTSRKSRADVRQQAVRVALTLLLSALVLAVVANVVDIRESLAMLRMLPSATLAATLLLVGLAYAVVGVRFACFMELVTPIKLGDSVRLNFALVFAAHVMGILSDAIRIRYLMRRYRLALDTAISASVADRLLSTWLLAWGLYLLFPFAPHTPLMLAGFATLSVALATGWLLACGTFWPAWIGAPLSIFARSIANRSVLWRQVAMQITVVAIVGATLWLLARAMDAELSLLVTIAFAPVALLATATPFTYAGLGAREAVFAVGLPILAPVTPESAVALSLGLGSCFLIGSLPGLLTLAPILKRTLR
jgi:uncharacterized membrane protein YbhN (UPF0104 family)